MSDEAYTEFAKATGAPIEARAVGLDALAHAYADARVVRDAADERAKNLREIEDRAVTALFDAMESQGLRSVRTERGLFSLNDIAWASVRDPDALRAWALEVHPEILSPNHQTLSVMVRQSLKGEGEAVPGVEATFSRKITWRRS